MTFVQWFTKTFPNIPLNTQTAKIAAAAWDEALNRLIEKHVPKVPSNGNAIKSGSEAVV